MYTGLITKMSHAMYRVCTIDGSTGLTVDPRGKLVEPSMESTISSLRSE